MAWVEIVSEQFGIRFKKRSVISWGGELVDLDDLTPQQREYALARSLCNSLNSINKGIARAEPNGFPPEEELFKEPPPRKST